MGKKRIYQLAKELNVNSKAVIEVARQKGFSVSNHMSTIGDNEERQLREVLAKKAVKTVNKNKPVAMNERPSKHHEGSQHKTASVHKNNNHKNEVKSIPNKSDQSLKSKKTVTNNTRKQST
ncbi:translation initiation factor IF-2 N-terminal domain-containing protein, partial [Liquorilactobacillus aquaticus]